MAWEGRIDYTTIQGRRSSRRTPPDEKIAFCQDKREKRSSESGGRGREKSINRDSCLQGANSPAEAGTKEDICQTDEEERGIWGRHEKKDVKSGSFAARKGQLRRLRNRSLRGRGGKRSYTKRGKGGDREEILLPEEKASCKLKGKKAYFC